MGKGASLSTVVRPTFESAAVGFVREIESTAAANTALAAASATANAKTAAATDPTVFDAEDGLHPDSCIGEYISRWLQFSGCSLSSFVSAGLYLRRSRVPLTRRNQHRLVLAALVVAVKASDDAFYANSFYATVGGVSPHEMNILEAAFLAATEWELYVSCAEYEGALTAWAAAATRCGSAASVAPAPAQACMAAHAAEGRAVGVSLFGSLDLGANALVDAGVSLLTSSLSALLFCIRPEKKL